MFDVLIVHHDVRLKSPLVLVQFPDVQVMHFAHASDRLHDGQWDAGHATDSSSGSR